MRDAYRDIAGATVFLSPHPDDTAPSCGGLVARLARDGLAPALVTVFGGDMVDEALSAYARGKHATWRMRDVDEVRARRRAEDEAAAAVLGCSLRWLGFPGAIYRADRYGDHDAVFRSVPHVDEQDTLACVIADEVQTLPEFRPDGTVVVPLAAGGHVDHQVLFDTGRVLASRGVRVLATEDCPYAIHTPDNVTRRLEAVATAIEPDPVLVDIDATLEVRVAAGLEYSSQVPNIFRFTDDPAEAIRGFARSRADHLAAAERFWRVRAAATRVEDPAGADAG